MAKILVVDPNGNEVSVSQKAFDLIYSQKGFKLKGGAKAEVREKSEVRTSSARTGSKRATKGKAKKGSKKAASKTAANAGTDKAEDTEHRAGEAVD